MKTIKRNWALLIVLVVLGLKYGTAQDMSNFNQGNSSPASDFIESEAQNEQSKAYLNNLNLETIQGSFKVKRVIVSSQFGNTTLWAPGKFTIEENKLTVTNKLMPELGFIANISNLKTYSNGNWQAFNGNTRYTFNASQVSLLKEVKDEFTGTVSTILYILKNI